MALARAMRILRLGVALGKPPSGGSSQTLPTFLSSHCPSGQGGYKYCLLHIHRLGTTPIGGFAPDLPSYGCAGPHLTKIQFRSRCVRAGIFYKTPREELSRYSPVQRMVPRPNTRPNSHKLTVVFLTSATPIWGVGVVYLFTHTYTFNYSHLR